MYIDCFAPPSEKVPESIPASAPPLKLSFLQKLTGKRRTPKVMPPQVRGDIFIYNPADIDSTIAAAYAMNRHGSNNVSAYPASNKVPVVGFMGYVWVGVAPSKQTLKRLGKTVTNVGYFAYREQLELSQRRGFDDLNLGDHYHWNYPTDIRLPESVFSATLILDESPGSAWWLAHCIERYMQGDKTLSLHDKATVYMNYVNAVHSLNTGMPFQLMVATDANETAYVSHMRIIQRQLSTLFEYTTIKIDNQYYKVPLVNVNQSMSPWVMKLLSGMHDFAVTYEQRRGTTVYTVFSRIAGFDKIILKQVANNPSVACLSHQL